MLSKQDYVGRTRVKIMDKDQMFSYDNAMGSFLGYEDVFL